MGKSEGSSGNWLMTYGDLMTLLLVFFVLLYTLTPNVNEGVFNEFISYFQNTPGFFDAENVNTNEFETVMDSLSAEDLEDLMEKRVEYWQSLADVLENDEFASEVDLELSNTGVKITLNDSLTFNSGSSELLPNAKVILNKVSDMIDGKILEVEVQGHTDNVPIKSSSVYPTNWHLGAARAVSVLQYIEGRASIDPSRFKASSFGEYNPVEENNSPEGRRKNRRVEIYLKDKILTDSETKGIWF